MIEYENLALLNAPFFDDYRKSFNAVMEKGWYILGERVKQFESEYAAYCGSPHCIGVANGLDALVLCLQVIGMEKGSEVIVPSNTYIASILAIVNAGFKPVLVEPDIRTYNIDPNKIEEMITPRTKAIMVVHLYGKTCEMDSIHALAKKYDLKVIEDSAQSHGAKYKGKRSGALGDLAAHSFYPTKNLGALADAGGITCQSDAYAEKLKALRNYGSNLKYFNEYLGMNSRLDEVQAAFLSVKLKKLDAINIHKRNLAAIYLKELKKDLILPSVHPDHEDVYHIFCVRHSKRDQLKEYLLSKGVKTEIHYPLAPNKQKAMQGILDGQETPIADEIHKTTLSLPISYFHTTEDIQKVCSIINAF